MLYTTTTSFHQPNTPAFHNQHSTTGTSASSTHHISNVSRILSHRLSLDANFLLCGHVLVP